MKKIALDGDLLFQKEKTGIGRHATEIISELVKNTQYEFYINYNWNMDLLRIGRKTEKEIIKKFEQYNVHFVKSPLWKCLLKKALKGKVEISYSFLFQNQVDISQFFNYYIPPDTRSKNVTIVHDMAYLSCPEYVSDDNKHWLKQILKNSCERANCVAVSSDFTKRELIHFLGIDSRKIAVIYSGIDKVEYLRAGNSKLDSQWLNEKGINEPYILYVGTIEQRKNISKIVSAFEKIQNYTNEKIQLVLVGKNGWGADTIIEQIESSPYKDYIVLMGYVTEVEKKRLYHNASVFVFPSNYEGFGIPVLEAMASGIPVVTSNVASIPEVVGDAALMVDPDDTEALYAAIKELLYNEDKRQYQIEKGYRQVEKFSWKNVADCLIEIYKKL